MRFLSLFSGVGGMDLGLERAGHQCAGQVEFNPWCRDVLAKHWPNVWRHDDVRTLTGEMIHEHCGPIDLIAGGDPCQRQSNARTHGREPESLAPEFLRIVRAVRPRAVLRENPAAVRKDAEWTGRNFALALCGLGYRSVVFPVRACCCGGDHRRARLFVFASLSDADGAGLEGHVCEVVAGAFDGGQDAHAARSDRRHPAPRVCRGADGIPHRVDRLRGLGNAVSPDVAEVIGRALA